MARRICDRSKGRAGIPPAVPDSVALGSTGRGKAASEVCPDRQFSAEGGWLLRCCSSGQRARLRPVTSPRFRRCVRSQRPHCCSLPPQIARLRSLGPPPTCELSLSPHAVLGGPDSQARGVACAERKQGAVRLALQRVGGESACSLRFSGWHLSLAPACTRSLRCYLCVA